MAACIPTDMRAIGPPDGTNQPRLRRTSSRSRTAVCIGAPRGEGAAVRAHVGAVLRQEAGEGAQAAERRGGYGAGEPEAAGCGGAVGGGVGVWSGGCGGTVADGAG